MFLFFPDQHQVLVSYTVYVLNTCCLRCRGRQRNSQRNRIPDFWQLLSPKYTGRFYGDRIVPSQLQSLRFSSNGVQMFPADNTLVIRLHKFLSTWNTMTDIFCYLFLTGPNTLHNTIGLQENSLYNKCPDIQVQIKSTGALQCQSKIQ